MLKGKSAVVCLWKVVLVICLASVTFYFVLTHNGNTRLSSLIPALNVNFRKISTTNENSNGHQYSNAQSSSQQKLAQSNSPQLTCSAISSWSNRLLNPGQMSDLTNWEFKIRVPCTPFIINIARPVNRTKLGFKCDDNGARVSTSHTMSSADIMAVPFGDQCLLKVVNTCCKDENIVPNVLHYVWYGKKEMGYFQFLSFMSGVRFMQPCLILLHGEYLPFGPYWDYFIQLSPNVVHVQRPRIQVIYGNRLSFPEHGADVMRIEAIQKYGGLYLDFDEILLRPIHPLRRYEMTMGRVLKDTLGNQFILAKQNAPFLELWHQSYKTYKTGHWTWNSLITPYKLSVERPELIHIDGYNFTRPSFLQTKLIFDENYDWSTNYGMHLFIRWYKKPIDINVIMTLNTTIGAVSRHILFGNKELCEH